MFHFHRRQVLRASVIGLANFIVGNPLTPAAQAETRRGIAHLHIPSDNGENFQWSLVTKNMQEFVAYLNKCGVRRGSSPLRGATKPRARRTSTGESRSGEVCGPIERSLPWKLRDHPVPDR